VDSTERFAGMFREHHLKIAAYARRRAGPDLAQEIVADTFLAAWRHAEDLPADPLPWLYRAAALALANRRRAAARDVRLSQRLSDAAAPKEADVADVVITASAWKEALGGLSDLDREVLLLAAWERLTPAQAGAVLHCSAVAYRVRLHRARRRLSALVHPETARGPRVETRTTGAEAASARSLPVILEEVRHARH
jgi:RNA polymerase sigma factor (sigma-70 family)